MENSNTKSNNLEVTPISVNLEEDEEIELQRNHHPNNEHRVNSSNLGMNFILSSQNSTPSSSQQQPNEAVSHTIQLEDPQEEEEEEESEEEQETNPQQDQNPQITLQTGFLQLRNFFQLVATPNRRRKAYLLFSLYYMGLSVGLVTVLLVDWSKMCDEPLRIWAITQLIIQASLISVNLFIMNKLPPRNAPSEYQQRRLESLSKHIIVNRILNGIYALWFIVGMIWVFSANTCSKTAPFLFRMSYTVIIIQLVLVGGIIALGCCAGFIFVIRFRFYPPDAIAQNPRGASQRLIRSLPSKKYSKKLKISKEDANCAICLSDYKPKEILRFLPCNHHFHKDCVDQWLLVNKVCPFCKKSIDPKEETTK